VCFLDFGMVIEFSADEHARRIARLIAADLRGDQAAVAAALAEVGLRAPDVDEAAMWADVRKLVLGPIDGGARRLDREYHSAALKSLGTAESKLAATMAKSPRIDASVVFWLRYALGALATISKLAPEADWRGILEEIVRAGEPCTPVGAAWGAAPGGRLFAGSQFEVPTA
jgi:predicted unusual protein kinase regulating ubiquinone biosynthesis (AarF/ABC1/UbiB family)